MGLTITEKDKQIVGLTIFTIFIVGDLVFGLGWQYRSLSKYNRKVNIKKQAIGALENDIRNLDRYKQEINDLDEKINNFEFLVKDEKEVANLIENISNLADNSGVKIKQIKPLIGRSNLKTVEVKDGKFSEVEIQILGESDFHQLGSFVSRIESAKTFFRVSSLEIETDNKNYYIQNIKLSLRTFVNREE